MARSSRLAAVVASTLALAGVMTPSASAAVVSPQALTATSVSGWTTTAVTMKLGGEVSRNVTVKPAAIRTVLVQARKGTTGTISTKATLKTSASGAVTVRFSPTSTGTWYWRLSVKATSTYAAATTAWRKVTVSGTAGSTTVTTPTVSPTTVEVPGTQKVSVTVKPAGVRSVEVWTKAPGASTFSLRARTSSSSTGAASVTWAPPTAGTWTYKVYVRPTLTLKGVWSATRTATVTRPPGVTGVTVDVSVKATEATLSWTNPPTFASIVVRRTLAAEPAPTTPSGGVDVPVLATDPPATTVTDTGLAAATAYRWTVFAISTQGGASTGVSVQSSTMASEITWTTGAPALDIHGRLSSISCPTTTSCLVGDERASIAVYGSGQWTDAESVPGATSELRAVSCATDMSCVLTTTDGDVILRSGAGSYSAPVHLSDFSLYAVGCTPTGTFCLAADGGRVFYSTDRTTWSSAFTPPSSTVINDIDCVSSTFCAIAGNFGRTWTFTGLVAGVPQLVLDPAQVENNVTSVDCTSSTFCVYGTDGGEAWERGGFASLNGLTNVNDVACASDTLCLAVDSSGGVASYDGSAWSERKELSGTPLLARVACPATTACVAIESGDAGAVHRWDGTTWTREVADPASGASSVSCVSGSSCMAVDRAGRAAAYDGTTWSAPVKVSYPESLAVVECASSTACFAADLLGNVYAYDGSGWTKDEVSLGGERVLDIACPTSSYCILTTDATRYATWDGSAWSPRASIDDGVSVVKIDCVTETYCLGSDGTQGTRIFDGKAWGVWNSSPNSVSDLACVAFQSCIGVVYGSVQTWNGTEWSANDPSFPLGGYLLSCTSANFCVTTAQTTLDSSTWDGSSWSPASSVLDVRNDVVSVSCGSNRSCVAVDGFGHTFLGTR